MVHGPLEERVRSFLENIAGQLRVRLSFLTVKRSSVLAHPVALVPGFVQAIAELFEIHFIGTMDQEIEMGVRVRLL